ncbi:MAG TPA: CHRD domain-containing protein [Terriglobales bacterium]
MKRTLVLATAILALVAAPLAASDKDKDNDDRVVRTHLVGYQETPLTINSPASGEFKATISDDGTTIHYELTWRDLSSGVLQSHIHFGRPAITGGIVLFLCTNLTPPVGPPTPQACPTTNPATITGTLTAADVIASTNGQGDRSRSGGVCRDGERDPGRCGVRQRAHQQPHGR